MEIELEMVSSGIKGLDEILQGGFVRGSAYIIQGPPGAGKTVLGNQVCFSHVAQGGRALYVTLLAESHARMISYMRNLNFYSPTAIPKSLQYISGYSVLEREGMTGLLKLVQHELRRSQAEVMVLDGLFVVGSSSSSEQEFRKFVHELQGIANLGNTVLLALTHQPRAPGSPEQTMVDGWIAMDEETRALRSFRTIQIRKHRGAGMLEGKHPMRIAKEGLLVFPRLEAAFAASPAETFATDPSTDRIASGVPELDDVIHGGIPRASATLVCGPTGVGKTTLGLQFLSRATPDEPALMVGFYETPVRVRLKAKSIGLDFDHLLRTKALDIHWWSPAENLADEIAWRIIEHVRERKVKRLFVDGLAALRANMDYPERLVAVVSALNNHLRELGVTLVYTAEVRDMQLPHVLPTDELSTIVDNVLLMSYRGGVGPLSRQLSILKVRDSNFDPRTREIRVAADGIQIGGLVGG